jgi:hypothetical protein
MPNTDALIVPLSDFQTGSNYALFPNRNWAGKNGNTHFPNSKQEAIYKQFVLFCEQVKQERKGKRLVVVMNGDAIEGVHHNNVDVCTRDLNDQAKLHIELVIAFKKAVGWQRGDKLYYVRGTETHTKDIEDDISDHVGAEQFADGSYIADHLCLTINGRELWFVHEGKRAGEGANEGNALRNWLKDIYYDALKAKIKPPDVVYSGHVHQPTYQPFAGNDNMTFHLMHGVILPSWQVKTRFAYRVAPVARNRIGGVTQVITASGDIRMPKFCVCETESVTRA